MDCNQGTLAIFRQLAFYQDLLTRQVATQGKFDLEDLLGVSSPMERVRAQVVNAARARACVVIRGEPGTGKSLIAQVIHSMSACKNGPFVTFSCASVPSELIVLDLLGDSGSHQPERYRPGRTELADGRRSLYSRC
jgi:transcriptional regulator with PAS, ATPase and Fis domain